MIFLFAGLRIAKWSRALPSNVLGSGDSGNNCNDGDLLEEHDGKLLETRKGKVLCVNWAICSYVRPALGPTSYASTYSAASGEESAVEGGVDVS